jgi:predicted DNA-binding protein
MVEALDRMVSESLKQEISEFAEEKSQLAADRVRFNKVMRENAKKFETFITTKLAEEVKELRQDRKQYENAISRLEQFTIKQLSEEIGEFAKDKQAVIETKVRLVAEAKQKLADLQDKFVKQSAVMVKEAVSRNLKNEMHQLKEDIQMARENNFGRRLFEAFASEFAITHLNENSEISKLKQELAKKDNLIAEARKVAIKQHTLVESREKEIRIIKESQQRQQVMQELMTPLNKEKQEVMKQLLESVQTDKLKSAYDKYLPAVLNNKNVETSDSKSQKVLTESRVEVTGDKSAKKSEESNDSNVIELKRLAGLN